MALPQEIATMDNDKGHQFPHKGEEASDWVAKREGVDFL